MVMDDGSTFLINIPICPGKNTSEMARLGAELDDGRGGG